MEANSVQSQEVSDLSEIQKENAEVIVESKEQEVSDEASERMPKGYKDDFFKQKEIARKERAEKQALLDKVKAYEEKENIAKGNFQKIIDTLKEENKTLKTQAEQDLKKKQYEKFNDKLKTKAEELGFTKPDRIINFISDKDMELLKIDQEYNIDNAGMDVAFQNIKKEWGELFKPKNVKIADGVPKTNIEQKTPKTAKEMTSAERIALAKKMINDKRNKE